MELRELTLAYGDRVVLERYSLTLPDRGLTYLSGPSGAGKTTLLRALAGLLEPRSGTIGLPGRPVMLFQEDRLFPGGTALDQVAALLPRERRGQAGEYLALTELTDAAGKKAGELSGGMARRLALARALAVEGEVYLLDEPFAGVDLARALRILARLRELGKPMVLTGHMPELAEACDRVVSL